MKSYFVDREYCEDFSLVDALLDKPNLRIDGNGRPNFVKSK